ncbi:MULTISPECIES: hypothetical protein [Desulfitobacterium]|uniref:Uncharacterized protein n=1 Tax=Desulfitobacterium chlororespirans DSM 11544 TaxID=1121395 RepID=A0A1M7UU36_9FIRM|nr:MULTISPECIES: hypothetical protein [Desulfitobacterium]SHN86479.1 hypothetical protein SAMN02745215_04643 [Desulfitobacterium chlororespirans DSM 11544]
MRIELKEPLNERAKVVDIEPGDRVLISEWDGITAIGNVAQITDSFIVLENSRFLASAYSNKIVDYSVFGEMTELVFKRSIICAIAVIENTKKDCG